MAYTYPSAYEGVQISFDLCCWNPCNDKHKTIYCPICDEQLRANEWPPLIAHENDHLSELGVAKFDGEKDSRVKQLRLEARNHVDKIIDAELQYLKDTNYKWRPKLSKPSILKGKPVKLSSNGSYKKKKHKKRKRGSQEIDGKEHMPKAFTKEDLYN